MLSEAAGRFVCAPAFVVADQDERRAACMLVAACWEESDDARRRAVALTALQCALDDGLWGDYPYANEASRRLVAGMLDGRWSLDDLTPSRAHTIYTGLQSWEDREVPCDLPGWRYFSLCTFGLDGALPRGTEEALPADRSVVVLEVNLRIAQILNAAISVRETRRDVAVLAYRLGKVLLETGERTRAKSVLELGVKTLLHPLAVESEDAAQVLFGALIADRRAHGLFGRSANSMRVADIADPRS